MAKIDACIEGANQTTLVRADATERREGTEATYTTDRVSPLPHRKTDTRSAWFVGGCSGPIDRIDRIDRRQGSSRLILSLVFGCVTSVLRVWWLLLFLVWYGIWLFGVRVNLLVFVCGKPL